MFPRKSHVNGNHVASAQTPGCFFFFFFARLSCLFSSQSTYMVVKRDVNNNQCFSNVPFIFFKIKPASPAPTRAACDHVLALQMLLKHVRMQTGSMLMQIFLPHV